MRVLRGPLASSALPWPLRVREGREQALLLIRAEYLVVGDQRAELGDTLPSAAVGEPAIG
jgi:hypothetical protein